MSMAFGVFFFLLTFSLEVIVLFWETFCLSTKGECDSSGVVPESSAGLEAVFP